MEWRNWAAVIGRWRRRRSRRRLPDDLATAYRPHIRRLEERRVLDVSAAFTSATGQLDILVSNTSDTATLSINGGNITITDAQNQAVAIDVDGAGPGTVSSSDVDRVRVQGDSAPDQVIVFDAALLLPNGLSIDNAIELADFRGAITQVVGGNIRSDATTTRLGADLEVTGHNISFGGNVELTDDVTLSAVDVSFEGQLDDDGVLMTGGSLLVQASGLTRFAKDIGSVTPLTRLETDAAGQAELNGNVTATGSTVLFGDPLTLTADTNITDTGLTGIVFGSTVDSAAGGHFRLSLSAPNGSIEFNGDIGAGSAGDQRLGALTVENAAQGVRFGVLSGVATVRVAGNIDIGVGLSTIGGTGVVLNGGASILEFETFGGLLRFNGPTVLETDVRISSAGGSVTFTADAPVDSQANLTQSLSIDAGSGAVFFQEDVGGNVELRGLTIVRADAGVVFGGADTETMGGLGPVERVRSVDAIRIGADHAIIGGIVLNGGSNPLSMTTTGDLVLFNGPVTLQSDVSIDTGPGPGDIRFDSGPTDSQMGESNDLILRAGTGAVFFSANLGATHSLGDLIVTQAAGGVTFGTADSPIAVTGQGPVTTVQAAGKIAIGTDDDEIGGTGIVLNGGTSGLLTMTTLAGSLRFNGPVILHTNVSLVSGGDVIFTNDAPIDSQSGETNDLTLDAPFGSISLNEDVGRVQALGTLTVVRAPDGVLLGGSINEFPGTGGLGPVEVIRLDGPLDIGQGSNVIAGGISLSGSAVAIQQITTTGDVVRFNGAVTLSTDVSITTSGANIVFTSAASIDSATGRIGGLTLDAGAAQVQFNEDIGATRAIGSLFVTRADGGVFFGGASVESVGPDLVGPVNVIHADRPIDLGVGSNVLTGGIHFNGGVLGTELTTTNDPVRLNGPVSLLAHLMIGTGDGIGDVTFTSAATIDSSDGPGALTNIQRSNLVIDAGEGGVFFNANLGAAQPLQQFSVIRAMKGVVFGGGDIPIPSGVGPVTLIRTDGTIDIGAGVAPENVVGSVLFNGGAAGLVLQTSGDDIRINGPGILDSALAVVTGPGSGDVTFTAAATLDSRTGELHPVDLTLDAGDALFEAAWGESNRLGLVTVHSAHDVRFLAALITTRVHQILGTGTTFFGGNVNTNHATLPGIDLNGSGFVFDAPVTATGNGRVIIVHTDLLDINDGADLRLDGAFVESGGGQVELAGDIATSGDTITFNDQVLLTDGSLASVLLSTVAGGSASGADIRFIQTLNGQLAGLESLLLNTGTGGDIFFDSAVGDTVRLGSITVVAARDVRFGQDLTAANFVQLAGQGSTVFSGAVALDHASLPALSVQTVNVSFVGPVTTAGDGSVVVTVSGQLDIGGNADMMLNGAFLQLGLGAVHSAADITTTGDDISFNGPVTLLADVALDTGTADGGVLFSNTLDGSQAFQQDLQIQAGAGDVRFESAIGSAVPLGSITIAQAGNVFFGAPLSVGSLTQSTGSGITLIAGTLTSLLPGGVISLRNQFIIVNSPILAHDSPVELSALNALAVNALISTDNSSVVLTAGADIGFGAQGAVITGAGAINVIADSDGVGGGGVLMIDGAVLQALSSSIHISATDDIAIGRLVAPVLISLRSINGGVIDSGDIGGADIESFALALRTGGGVGGSDLIETRVEVLAAMNSGAGGIRITNDRNGLLTIGEVDGLSGLKDGGSGQIEIIHHGAMDVEQLIANGGGGDTILRAELTGDMTVRAPIQNTGGNGFIFMFAGGDLVIHDSLPEPIQDDMQLENPADGTQFFEIMVVGQGGIRGQAVGKVLVDDGEENFVILHTDTGQVTNVPPIVMIETLDQGGSDVDAFGRGFVQVTLGDEFHLETNYHITIDWGDGEIESFPIPGTINPLRLPEFNASDETRFVSGNGQPGVYVFLHKYFSNPNTADPSAPIPIRVDVRYDARSSGNTTIDNGLPVSGSAIFNGVRFFENVDQEIFTTLGGFFTVPGTGAFGFVKVVESVIVPVELRAGAEVPILRPTVSFVGSMGLTEEFDTTSFETESFSEYRVYMRVVDDVHNTEGPDIPLDDNVLDDPIAIFRNRRFPNGHYRIYMEEIRTRRSRVILDVHIYNGRVVPPNFREGAGEKQRGDQPEQAPVVPPGPAPDGAGFRRTEFQSVRENGARENGDGLEIRPTANAVLYSSAPDGEHDPPGLPNVGAADDAAVAGDETVSAASVGGVVAIGSPQWRARLRRALTSGQLPQLNKAARRRRRLGDLAQTTFTCVEPRGDGSMTPDSQGNR